MGNCTVVFEGNRTSQVASGKLLTEAATEAGVYIDQPCGGQGRCGRCAVQVTQGEVRRRSTLRLSAEDVAAGYALACQTTVLTDLAVVVPDQDTLERHITTDRVVAEVAVPEGYDPQQDQSVRRLQLTLPPPSMDDQTDDWSRLQTAVRKASGIPHIQATLPQLRRLSQTVREGNWEVTLLLSHLPDPTSPLEDINTARLIDLLPGHHDVPLLGLAIDIGTTTVSVWLADLMSGKVLAQAAEYNRQIRRGEDIISRIIFASKNGRQHEMQNLVLESINTLIERVCQKASLVNEQTSIVKAVISGNSTMMHMLLDIPADSIRLSPFVTAVNHIPVLTAAEVGLVIHPDAVVSCLPGVASYVGADISAGVLSSGLDDMGQVTLFMDVGTNGEIVLGNQDWLVTCACSAGPAFEGGGVGDGMRATRGAIESVWINGETYEPSLRIIGQSKPKGICGSGLIALLGELFLTGIIDKAGHFNPQLPTNRIRKGEHGGEYVLAWADETWHGQDIVITRVDVDNLIRAKAAIYAGFSVLADAVGVPLETVEQVLIGGSFGKHINVEKAIQIGLLPDRPWEDFYFLGNTSVLGAYYALLSRTAQQRIRDIAGRMTYIELSADNSFYDAFTSALFLPHTDKRKFPSVVSALPLMNLE